jgi:hypothetical protein
MDVFTWIRPSDVVQLRYDSDVINPLDTRLRLTDYISQSESL